MAANMEKLIDPGEYVYVSEVVLKVIGSLLTGRLCRELQIHDQTICQLY